MGSSCSSGNRGDLSTDFLTTTLLLTFFCRRICNSSLTLDNLDSGTAAGFGTFWGAVSGVTLLLLAPDFDVITIAFIISIITRGYDYFN